METNLDKHVVISKKEKRENTLTNLLMHRRNVVSQEQVKRYVLTRVKNRRDMKPSVEETQDEDAQVDWMALSKQRSQQEEIENFVMYLKQIENIYKECGIPFSDQIPLPTDDLDVFRQLVMYEIQYWAPIQELAEIGSSFDFYVIDTQQIKILIEIANKDVIPENNLLLDAHNQIQRYPFTQKEYMLLLKQYVLGLTIRIAREIYSFLPFQRIDVQVANQFSDFEKSKNIWLAVKFAKTKFEKIDFEKETCEEILKNMACCYQFDEIQGFLPINV